MNLSVNLYLYKFERPPAYFAAVVFQKKNGIFEGPSWVLPALVKACYI